MNMCPSRKIPPELCLKGQVFFLWSNQQNVQLANEKIPLLGGRVDAFLSREITTILIDDFHLAAFQYFPGGHPVERNYFNSPHLLTFAATHQHSLFNLPSTSQGYNFGNTTNSVNQAFRIISYGIQWGIAISGFAYFFSLIDSQLKTLSQPKKKQNQSISNLSGTFIKFECQNKKFRPCFKVFNNDTERLMPLKNATVLVKVDNCKNILNSTVPRHVQHFNPPNPDDRMCKAVNEHKLIIKPGDKKAINKAKPKEENNYCECCRSHYSDLKLHLKSVNHLKFVSDEKNYETVMDVMKFLPTLQDFMAKHQKPPISTNKAVSNVDVNNLSGINVISEPKIPLPTNRHLVNSTPSSLQMKEDMPLNLHVETLDDSEIPDNLFMNCTNIKSSSFLEQQNKLVGVAKDFTSVQCDPEFDLNRVKTEPLDDDNLPEVKTNDKDVSCSPDPLPEDLPNQTVPADVPNSASLAQICLKNFDSYWLDSLPNEEKDIFFDDNIFDLDDGRQRLGEIYPDNIDNASQAQGLASCISSMQLQSSLNISMLMNSAGEVKDIGVKSTQSDLDLSPYKMDYINHPPLSNPLGIDKLLSVEKEPVFESYKLTDNADISDPIVLEPYKIISNIDTPNIVDIDTYKIAPSNANSPVVVQPDSFRMTPNTDLGYFEKSNPQASCSNMPPEKSAEKMFSDDSEDEVETNEKIGNSFIYSVLNIITNSDNETKTCKLSKVLPVSSDSGMKMDSKIVSNVNSENETNDKIINIDNEVDKMDEDFSSAENSNIKVLSDKINADSRSKSNFEKTDLDSKSNLEPEVGSRVSPNTFSNSVDVEINVADSGLSVTSKDFEAKNLENSLPQSFNMYPTIQASNYPIEMIVDKNSSNNFESKAQDMYSKLKVINERQEIKDYPLELNVNSESAINYDIKSSVIQSNVKPLIECPLVPMSNLYLTNTCKTDINYINRCDENAIKLESTFKDKVQNQTGHISNILNDRKIETLEKPTRLVDEYKAILQSERVERKKSLNLYEAKFSDKSQNMLVNPEPEDLRSFMQIPTCQTKQDTVITSINAVNKNDTEILDLHQNINFVNKYPDQLETSIVKLSTCRTEYSPSKKDLINKRNISEEKVFETACIKSIHKDLNLAKTFPLQFPNSQVERNPNSNCLNVTNNNYGIFPSENQPKPVNRDHAIQIPKKRYTSTISREFDLQNNKSYSSNVEVQKNVFQTIETKLENCLAYKGNFQNALPIVDEKKNVSKYIFKSETCKDKVDCINSTKQVKRKLTSKKNVKPIKRKRSVVSERRTRRYEVKHSTSNSMSIINTSQEKPKMNLYTSYRISQSKTLPNVRMPPKKSLPKLKKLPSIWRITKIRGLLFRFTCVQHESFRSVVSCDEYEFNE